MVGEGRCLSCIMLTLDPAQMQAAQAQQQMQQMQQAQAQAKAQAQRGMEPNVSLSIEAQIED